MLFKSAAIAAAVLSFISTSSAQASVATVYRYVDATATIYADYCPCPTQGLGGAATGSGSGSSGTGSSGSVAAPVGSGSGSSGSGVSGTSGSGTGSSGTGSGTVVVVPGSNGNGAVPGANGGGVIVGPGSQPGYQVIVSISVGVSVGVTTSTFVNNGATFTSVITTTATITTPVTLTSAIGNGVGAIGTSTTPGGGTSTTPGNGGAGVGAIGTSTTPGGGTSTTFGQTTSTPLFSNSTISSTTSNSRTSAVFTTSASSSAIGTSTTPGAGTSTTSTVTPTTSSTSSVIGTSTTPGAGTSTSSTLSTSTTPTTSASASATPPSVAYNIVVGVQYNNGGMFQNTVQSVPYTPGNALSSYMASLSDTNNPSPMVTYNDPSVVFYLNAGSILNGTLGFEAFSQTLINSGSDQVITPVGTNPGASTADVTTNGFVVSTADTSGGDPLNPGNFPLQITVTGAVFYLTTSTTIGIAPGNAFPATPPADNNNDATAGSTLVRLYAAPVGNKPAGGRPQSN